MLKMPDVEPRRREALLDFVVLTERTANQTTRLLRIIIFVRAEPALKEMTITAFKIENFESHEPYLGPDPQNSILKVYRRAQRQTLSAVPQPKVLW